MSNNLSIGNEAKIGYERVLKGDPAIDWAIFSLASAGNELKLQSTGSGLDDLEEEFMDGRIQYAFARVEDPNSQLEKFVQINWCGDGVAERQKGLFNIYSPQISTFLKNSHIVLQARSEADVTPQQIRKRLNESSGSKYTPGVQGAGASSSRDEQAQAPPPVRKTVPTTFAKPSFGSAAPPIAKKTVESAPAQAVEKPSSANTAPSTASGSYSFSKPTPGASVPTASAAAVPAAMEPVKPKEDDRIAPVGTAYTPVSLGTPGKLANRWGAKSTPAADENDSSSTNKADTHKSAFGAARGAFSGGGGGTGGFGAFKGIDQVNYGAGGGAGGAGGPSPGKKLTWSERQAEAKRQREEEEQGAQSAMAKAAPTPSIARDNSFAPPPAAASRQPSFAPPAPTASAPSLPGRSMPPAPSIVPPRPSDDDDEEKEEDNDDWETPAPPPPPPPPMPAAEPEPEAAQAEDDEESYPPPPTPPPMPNWDEDDAGVKEITRLKSELTLGGSTAPPPVPVGTRPGVSAPAGLQAIAGYDYEAAEDNEVSMTEGEKITDIEKTDDDWWTGTNTKGDRGLFPSNYVELIEGGEEDDEEPLAPPPPPMPQAAPAALPPRSMPPPPAAAAASNKGKWAIAAYDYEQAEENELSFAEGEEITQIEETDEAWWTGTNKKGEVGLFPANYVELQ